MHRQHVGRRLCAKSKNGRKIIERQRDLIDHRKSAGLCTISSEGVLSTFETRQALLERDLAELRGLRSTLHCGERRIGCDCAALIGLFWFG